MVTIPFSNQGFPNIGDSLKKVKAEIIIFSSFDVIALSSFQNGLNGLLIISGSHFMGKTETGCREEGVAKKVQFSHKMRKI